MRATRLLILLMSVLWCRPLLCQEVQQTQYADTSFSQNHKYFFTISGRWLDDGPHGPQEITLYEGSGQFLWKNTFDAPSLAAMPIVSNNGVVAIYVYPGIRFFNSSGARIEKFNPSPHEVGTELFKMLQAFGDDGNTYYTFVTAVTMDSTWLVVLHITSGKIRRQFLGAFQPDLLGSLHIFRGRVVAFGFNRLGHGRHEGRMNQCYVFNKMGKPIWQYKQKSRGRKWFAGFNAKTGMITIVDGPSRKVFDVDSL